MPAKLSVSTDTKAIKRFLTRGVENVYPNRDAVEAALTSGRRLRVYLGVDPTGPSLHLGHAIPMRKLAELQALGHEVILLIGDFTAMIGDPTDKLATRKQLTRKEVLVNAKNYKTQAARFLRFTGVNAASVEFNSKWLAKLSFADLIEITAHFTVQQLMSRDMFRKREYWQLKCRHCHKMFFSPIQFGNMEAFESTVLTDNTATCPNCGKDTQMEKEDFLAPSLSPIYEHEFLYPIMQAYDSIAMDVDMEIGGNDQTYNMLAGRTLMKKVKNKEKYVLTTKILADPSGKKMGKSEGNMIALTDSPEEMYGKVMTWTDEMIVPGFELATDISDSEIEEIQSRILKGENPFEYKRRLAHEVVRTLVGEGEARNAEANFSKVHQAHEAPSDMPKFKARGASLLVDVLAGSGLVASKTDARRQIEQGGVKVDGKAVKDVNATVKAGMVVQKGKRHFIRLV